MSGGQHIRQILSHPENPSKGRRLENPGKIRADREPERLLPSTKEKVDPGNVRRKGSEIADFAHRLGYHKNS